MGPVHLKYLFTAFVLVLSLVQIDSQTHLKLILETTLPIDYYLLSSVGNNIHCESIEAGNLRDSTQNTLKFAKNHYQKKCHDKYN